MHIAMTQFQLFRRRVWAANSCSKCHIWLVMIVSKLNFFHIWVMYRCKAYVDLKLGIWFVLLLTHIATVDQIFCGL